MAQMSRVLSPIPAKPTFSNLRDTLYQSDYLNRKKGTTTYCNHPSICSKLRRYTSYSERSLYKKGLNTLQQRTCNTLPCGKTNLVVGQYSRMDLKGACDVFNYETPCNPTLTPNECLSEKCANSIQMQINENGQWYSNTPLPNTVTPFYQFNTIDPLGTLFGNSQCGELNYTTFMVYNLPKVKFAFA